MTLQQLAAKLAEELHTGTFNRVDAVASKIADTKYDSGLLLTDSDIQRLLKLIERELLLRGGIPAYIRDASNAGSVDVLTLLASKISAARKK